MSDPFPAPSGAGTLVVRSVYLSFSPDDAPWAQWLRGQLVTCRLASLRPAVSGVPRPPAPVRIRPVMGGGEEPIAGSSLEEKAIARVVGCDFLIVICSPRAARSRRVNEEIVAFKAGHGDERVLTLVVDGEPLAVGQPGSLSPECFPPAARFRVNAAREVQPVGTRPLVADARAVGEGRARARLKILGALCDLTPDEVARRETGRRRQRLLAGLAVIVFIGFLLGLVARLDAYRKANTGQLVLLPPPAPPSTNAPVAPGPSLVTTPPDAQAQATARQMLELGRGEFLAGHHDRALPYLAAAWKIVPDAAGLRLMLDETLKNLDSIAADETIFSHGVDGGAFTPDGHTLLTWSRAEGTVRILPLGAEGAARSLDVSSGHQAQVADVRLDQAGVLIGVARATGARGTLALFDPATGQARNEFDLPDLPVRLERMHTFNKMVVGLKHGRLVIFDLDTGQIAIELPPLDAALVGDIDRLVFSPNDRYLAVGGMGSPTVTVYDLSTGRPAWTATAARAGAPAFAFSPDSRKVLWLGGKNGVDLLDADSGQSLSHLDLGLKDLCPPLSSCAYRPDGGGAIFGSDRGRAFLCDFTRGIVLVLPADLGAPTRVGFGADGRRAITAQSGVTLWDAATGTLLSRWAASAPIDFLGLGSDPILAAAGEADGRVRVFRADRPLAPTIVPSSAPARFHFPAQRVVHAASGRMLVFVSTHELSLRDIDGKSVRLTGTPTADAIDAAFNPDGDAVGLAFADGSVGVWDARDGSRLAGDDKPDKGGPCQSLALGDRDLFLLRGDGLVEAIDYRKNVPAGSFVERKFRNGASRLQWAAGRLAVFNGNAVCKIYRDAGDAHPVTIALAVPAARLAISPDGHRLAFGTKTGEVTIWDTTDGHRLQTLPPHPGAIALLRWSPSGRYLLSATTADELYLNDATGGAPPADFGKLDGLQDAGFAQGDDLVVISLRGGRVIVGDRAANKGVVVWSVTGDLLGDVAADPDGTRFYVNGTAAVYAWNLASAPTAETLDAALARDRWQLDGLALKAR